MMRPYHARLRHDHVHWYIKLIPRHSADELHVKGQTGGSNVGRKVLDDSVKVSSSPAQSVSISVPDDTWNEDYVNSIEAHWMNILRFGL